MHSCKKYNQSTNQKRPISFAISFKTGLFGKSAFPFRVPFLVTLEVGLFSSCALDRLVRLPDVWNCSVSVCKRCAFCGNVYVQWFSSIRSTNFLNSSLLRSVDFEPRMSSFERALVKATLTLRQSLRRSPIFPSGFERTKDIIIHSLSRPWNLSAVWISTAGLPRRRYCMALTCDR